MLEKSAYLPYNINTELQNLFSHEVSKRLDSNRIKFRKGESQRKNGTYDYRWTAAGTRTIPMMDFVRDAFLQEKQNQEDAEMRCEVTVDGYTDFIFINRHGKTQHQGTLNKAIRRIVRDCNNEILDRAPDDAEFPVLLPLFSCHSLRHTFATRLCEQGINIKVMQDVLGHKDITTTMDIYVDVTQELKQKEFEGLDSCFGQ